MVRVEVLVSPPAIVQAPKQDAEGVHIHFASANIARACADGRAVYEIWARGCEGSEVRSDVRAGPGERLSSVTNSSGACGRASLAIRLPSVYVHIAAAQMTYHIGWRANFESYVSG